MTTRMSLSLGTIAVLLALALLVAWPVAWAYVALAVLVGVVFIVDLLAVRGVVRTEADLELRRADDERRHVNAR
ncbi:MAG: hypothetical protein KDC46_03955 [Thermoleophilia bacterium]|nr:hypothetical protein [Thermoleophilia bacterium]